MGSSTKFVGRIVPLSVVAVAWTLGAACSSSDGAPADGNAGDAASAETTVAAACSATQTSCGARCVDLATDSENCGACDKACAKGTVCSPSNGGGSACSLFCSGGTTNCGAACADLRFDPFNCGACGVACGVDQVCANSTCKCTNAALTLCGNACVDLKSDPAHCATCATACAEGRSCFSGVCDDLPSCGAILAAHPGTASGVYTIDPDAAGPIAPFSAYCDMTTEGGGWTLVLGVVPTDGSQVNWFNTAFWQSPFEYGTFAGRFSGDYKSPAASTVGGTSIMVQVASGANPADVVGYRGWALPSNKIFNTFFAAARNTVVTNGIIFSNTGGIYAWEPLLKFGTELIVNRFENDGDATRLGVTPHPTFDNLQPGLGTAMNLDCCGDDFRHADVELQTNGAADWCSTPTGDGTYKWIGSDVQCGGTGTICRRGYGACQSTASPPYTPAWNYRIYMR